MMEKTIVVIKTGQLTEDSRKQLIDAGYMVLEVDDPKSVRILSPASEPKGDMIMRSALHAMAVQDSLGVNSSFVAALDREIKQLNNPNS